MRWHKLAGRSYLAVVIAFLVLAAAGLSSPRPATAKTPSARTPEFSVFHWSVQDGLPQSSVTDIVRDRAGFLWFGTFDGLVRFDGVRFHVYRTSEHPGLPSDKIDRVWVGPDDRLWVATLDGLAWFDGDQFERGPAEVRGAIAHAVDRRGRTLISSRSNRIFALAGAELHELPTPPASDGERVDGITLAAAEDGQVWAERGESLYRLENDRWVRVLSSEDWPPGDRRIHGLGARQGGGLWIVTENRVLLYHQDQLTSRYARADSGGGNYVRVIDLDTDGLWTASLVSGAVRYRAAGTDVFDERNLMPHDAVRVVYRGQEDHVWLGTDGGGLVQLRRAPVRTWSTPQGLGERIVRATEVGPDGRLYLATHGEGIWAFDGERFHGPIPTAREGRALWVWALHLDRRRELWAGFLQDGVSRIGARQNHALGRPAAVHALADHPSDGVLAGTTSGLFSIQAGGARREQLPVRSSTVTAMHTVDGVAWAGTSRGDVFRQADDEWTVVAAAAPSSPGGTAPTPNPVRSIRSDPAGRVWVIRADHATIQSEAEWERFGPEQGLGDFAPTDVAFDEAGRVWLAGRPGIARFELSEVLEAARGGPPASRVSLNETDGLRSIETNHVETWRRDGRSLLVFSTLDGISVVDPANLELPSMAPHVAVDFLKYHTRARAESVTGEVEHTRIAQPRGRVELPAETDHLTIGLAAPSFADPDGVRFTFRLDGPTGSFRGSTANRDLTLHSPRPGKYRLEVDAETHHGKRSEKPAVLEYRIAAGLFESTWFIATLGLAVVILLLAIFSVRSAALRRTADRERGLRQSEQKYRALERKLMETQRLESLGLLAGGIAHDFNNLLTGILANAELLKDSTASSDESEMVDGIVQAGRRAAELCEQMLAYSGRGRMMVETADLNRIVDETIRLLRRSVGPDVSFVNELEAGVLAVDVDPAQIRQVVMNLLTNASEALEGGAGSIRVSTTRRPALSQHRLETAVLRPQDPDRPFCCMEVVDEGRGMDRETQARIFEPFFTTKATGRGLGLAATLGIVQGHGGALFVQSEVGRGSRFGLCLPASAKVPAPPSDDDITPASGLPVRNVLVVDDEASIRSIVRRTFRQMNFTVIEAANGREALELFERMSGSFDLIYLDLTMPEMDGAEVLQRLRASKPDIPVILMSGYARQSVLERVGDQPHIGFLQKPFGVHDLLRATNAAVPPALEDVLEPR